MINATCDCEYQVFIIQETRVICADCGKVYNFGFIDDAKILCETKANDIVKLVEDG